MIDEVTPIFIYFNKSTGLYGGEAKEVRDRGELRSLKNIWGGMAHGYALELDANDGTGQPTGRVFHSLHTSETLKAALGGNIITNLRHAVEDLPSDRSTWTDNQIEMDYTYNLLKDRCVEIDCCDPASNYQAFVNIMLDEGVIDEATKNEIILGKLIRDINA